jgi:DNA-binding FadR family transcriptional regulator
MERKGGHEHRPGGKRPVKDKVQLRTLPIQVAGLLIQRIATNTFPDGLVPSELQILTEFSVSRAVAREALKILSSLDMVEIAQGRRVTVRPIAEWDYLNPLLIEWLPHDQVRELLLELHDSRVILEPAIAAEAARSLSGEDLARLRDLLDGMSRTHDDPDSYIQLDLEFHMEICRATRNRILDRFMFSSRWWQSAARRISNQAPRALPIATEQHRSIYEALAARDPKRAEAAMRVHLEANKANFLIEEQLPRAR